MQIFHYMPRHGRSYTAPIHSATWVGGISKPDGVHRPLRAAAPQNGIPQSQTMESHFTTLGYHWPSLANRCLPLLQGTKFHLLRQHECTRGWRESHADQVVDRLHHKQTTSEHTCCCT